MTDINAAFPNLNQLNNRGGIKTYPMLECPRCGKNGMLEVTEDGGKNQRCSTCEKVLRSNGHVHFWHWLRFW